MELTLVTPEKTVLDSVAVEEVLVPGTKGEMGILPGHAPLVSTLGRGLLKYRAGSPTEKAGSPTDRQKTTNPFQEVAVSWGYLEVQPDKVIVLAESAETQKV